jgi:acyl-homoserine lactone acylase PvdQ
MRRFDCLLLTALLAGLFALAGCGSPEPEPAPAPPAGPSAEDTVDMAADTMEALPADAADAAEAEATPEPAPAPAEASGESVTIYRDEWGVPHIYANTDRAAAYGIGYAQAEDRLDDIYTAVRTGLGKMSEVFGKDYTQQDYAMRLLKNEELAKEYMATAPEHLAAISEGYVDGVNAYLAENPDAKPEFALDLEPYMLLTVGRR